MGLFKRGEVVDLTEWKRRGLLEVPEAQKPLAPLDKQGMLDFTTTSMASSEPVEPVSIPASVPSFDFLDTPQPASSALPVQAAPTELNELKLKLDDTMFKLDLLLDKIRSIEQRLSGS